MVLALSTFSATLFAFVVVTRNSGPPPRPQNQVLLRSVESNSAGMGSVIQQLQRTIIFGGVLGAEVFSVESFSEHGYDTVGLINSMRNTVMNTVDLGRVCKLTRYMSQDTDKRITDQACATHLQGANATAFLADWELTALKRLEKCAVVIQD